MIIDRNTSDAVLIYDNFLSFMIRCEIHNLTVLRQVRVELSELQKDKSYRSEDAAVILVGAAIDYVDSLIKEVEGA